MPGLTNGDDYTFTVAATNAAGTSAPSDPSRAVTPRTPLSFTLSTATTGGGPNSVAIGDLNADGRPDLVTADSRSDVVSVLLAGGPTAAPTYTRSTTTTGRVPNSVAIGDLNADGRPDLVTADNLSDVVSVLLAGGPIDAPTYTRSTASTGDGPASVAIGDLNADGRPDLVTADAGSNVVSVLLAAGPTDAPTWTRSTATTGRVPVSVAIGDLNADGRPDLATADFGSGTVSVLLAGGPTAAPTYTRSTTTTGTNPNSVAIGDLNGDGRPDLVTADFRSDAVSVLLAGGPTDAPTYTRNTTSTGNSPVSVAIGDLDGDGRPDLVTADAGRNTVSVLLAGGPTDAPSYTRSTAGTGSNPASVAIEDLNADGLPDLATADTSSNAVSVLLQAAAAPGAPTAVAATAGNASAAVSFTAPASTGGSAITGYTVTATDSTTPGNGGQTVSGTTSPITVPGLTNGDDYTFTVTATNAVGASAPSNPSRAVTPRTPLSFTRSTATVGSRPFSVAVGDLNGDGRPDLVTADFSSDAVSVLLAGGPTDAPTYARSTATTGRAPFSVAIGDLNGDGRPDLVTADANSSTVSVLLAGGPTDAPTYTRSTTSTGSSPYSVAIGDLNGDGRPDLVTADFGSNAVSVLLAGGPTDAPTYTRSSATTGTNPRSVAIGDLNGDGRPDLVTADLSSDAVSVLLAAGPTDAPTYTRSTTSTGARPTSVAIGDLNGDTRPDLVTTDSGSNTVSVLLAGGPTDAPTYTRSTTTTGTRPNSVAIGDLSGDGRPDLVTTDSGSNAVSVLLAGGPTDAPTYTRSTAPTGGDGPISVAIGDLNGDGRPDLVTADFGSDAVSVLLQGGPAATAPGAPTAVSATAGNASAAVSFTAPASTGGSPVTGYTVTATDSTTPGNGGQSASGTTSPIRVPGLTNGDSYTFTVRATNAAGSSTASSPSNAVTPRTVPGAPTAVGATAGNASAAVSFTAPASTGGSPVTGYTVTATDSTTPGNGGQTASGTTSPITVPGLTNGDSYTFTVRATNAAGSSTASSPSNAVTPRTVPGAPTAVGATAGNASAAVSFTAPASTGGSPITSYTVTATDSTTPGNGGQSASGTTSPITVPGLTNGDSYTFTVRATNAAGSSTPSSPSNAVTPRTVPGAPTAVGATAGNASAAVSFTAPASTGGSPITGYTVTATGGTTPGNGGQTATGSTSPITVPGLTNGDSYTFTVRATNAAGSSTPSSPSNAVTPRTVPGAPTAVGATAGNASAAVSFTAPASTGGSPITSYTVTATDGTTAGQRRPDRNGFHQSDHGAGSDER